MPHTFYYLRGAAGDTDLLATHRDTIEQILEGDYTSKNIEKLRGHDIYSLRLRDAERLLFTTITINGVSYFLVLEYLPTHDYHKSRFLRSGVLRDYVEKITTTHDTFSTGAEDLSDGAAAKGELEFEAILPEAMKVRMAEVVSNEEATLPMVLDYYQKKIIVLSYTQESALNVPLPAVISGVAGSGKSCVAMSLLSSYLLSQAPVREGGRPQRLLYVSQSAHLVKNIEATWHELPLSVDNPHQVSFLTYDDLLKQVEGLDDSVLLVGKQAFADWYTIYMARQTTVAKASGIESPLLGCDRGLMYQEFRICSGYDKEYYLSLGQRQSFLETRALREALYAAYQDYFKYLDGAGLDPAFYPFQAEATYDLVVVDEAQDFSHSALKNLYKIAINGSVVYCMDSHQRLNDRRSVRPYLLEMLGIDDSHHITLDKTYRCPLKVVHAANEVIALKQRLAGGIADKHEATKITSIGEDKSIGQVYVVTPEQLKDSDWLSAEKGANCAVVTSEECREEAKDFFKTELVFTPEDIKGLEYDVVVAYRLYDESLFKNARKRLKALEDSKQPMHQAKSGARDDQFGPAFNRIFTSYTRARETLVVCEEATRDAKEVLLDKLHTIADEGLPLVDAVPRQNTQQDWCNEVKKQFEVGNEALAINIYNTKIKSGNEVKFNELVGVATAEAVLPVLKSEKKSKKDDVNKGDVPAFSPEPSTPRPHKTNKNNKKRRSKVSSIGSSNPHLLTRESDDGSFVRQEVTKLDQNFTSKRLLTLLKLSQMLSLEQLFFGEFLSDAAGKKKSLLMRMQESAEKQAVFFSCLEQNPDVLKKLPMKAVLEKLKGKKTKGFKQKLLDILAPKDGFYSAEVTIRGTGFGAPACLAALRGNVNELLLLYKLGVNLSEMDDDGKRPAYIAAYNGHAKALRVFHECGVDLNLANNNGSTPVQAAAYGGHVEALCELHAIGIDLTTTSDIVK